MTCSLDLKNIRPGGQAEVTVSDAGKGLAEGDLERVFDAFLSVKQDKMGMGLLISRSIVETHGEKGPKTAPMPLFLCTRRLS